MENTKPKTVRWKKFLYIFIGLIFFTLIVPRIFTNVSKDEIQKMAFDDVLKELQAGNNPTGMLGATWYMSRQELKNLFNDLQPLDENILIRSTQLYRRPIQASYSFQDDKLVQVIASFKDEVKSIEKLSDTFYATQKLLSSDYGEMPNPIVNEVIPPINGKWADQNVVVSKTAA